MGTHQKVSVTIEDVKMYADFMMKLIVAGFTDVSASFESSQANDFKDMLIKRAIESSQKKAETIAKASNRTIHQILKVSDTEESDFAFSQFSMTEVDLMKLPSPSIGITEIPQTISKKYAVKVVFGLK